MSSTLSNDPEKDTNPIGKSPIETPAERDSSLEKGANEKVVLAGPPTFPEGGARAWSVVAGTSGVLFCTFGYANAFG